MLSLALFSEAKAAPVAWLRGEVLRALALFGGVKLDLRGLEPTAEPITVNALALFGSVEVTVPPGAELEDSECFALFGAVSLPRQTGTPGAGPLLQLNALALFGSVSVKVRD